MRAQRIRLALLLCTALPPTQSLGAQQPSGALPVQTGTWTYSSRVDQGVQARNDVDRIVTVSDTTQQGVPAWKVTLLLDTGAGVLVDTLLMRKDNFAPIWRRSVSDTIFEIVYQVEDSTVTGFTRMPGRNGPISVRLLPNTFFNYHAFRLFFRSLPLAPGYTATAAMMVPRGDSGQVVPLTITVGREERIFTPAGACDCLVVLVQGQGIVEFYWIDKHTRHVVRTRESFGGQGAVLQLDLAGFQPN
jgi:hypothetical protein